jgi:diadenylate cyclase
LPDILNYLIDITPKERFLVLVELLIIGVIVYWTVSFLEGTRGERLFRGAISILIIGSLVLKLFVKTLHLDRIDNLYNYIAVPAILVIVVAFQPEIRRALIRLGQARFLPSSPQQLSRSVEEIISAVTQLAATKTGAIIVIQQQVGLGEFIDTGVKVDSKVTAEMLKTVFYPGTVLHDMAVVIQGDRIVAARVQLPLAEAEAIGGRQLGSRHRASIGVTTSSDATVIVVSEETGIISVAVNGNLIRNASESQLRRYLATAVVETTPLVEQLQETQKAAAPAKKTKNEQTT